MTICRGRSRKHGARSRRVSGDLRLDTDAVSALMKGDEAVVERLASRVAASDALCRERRVRRERINRRHGETKAGRNEAM